MPSFELMQSSQEVESRDDDVSSLASTSEVGHCGMGIDGGPKAPRDWLAANGHSTWDWRHIAAVIVFGCVAVMTAVAIVFREMMLSETRGGNAQSLFGTPRGQELTTPFPTVFDSRGPTTLDNFISLGCYPMVGDDSVANMVLLDDKCATPSAGTSGLCRSGLPWYRLAVVGKPGVVGSTATMSVHLCASFCLFKGFDISGVVQSSECRCGASAEASVWGSGASRPDLAWQPPGDKVPGNDPKCRIVAHQHLGPIPSELDTSSEDLAYFRSILRGTPIQSLEQQENPDIFATAAPMHLEIDPTEAPPFQPQQAWLKSESVLRGASGPTNLVEKEGAKRTCYPYKCASGWPWPIWGSLIHGIPFAFSNTTDEEMRRVFREAIASLHARTCIRFNEVAPSYNKTFKILVKGVSEEVCGCSPIGYPATTGKDTEIMLGWCTGEEHRGSMIHEICHALGMAHEHVRSDRDKYVQVNWAQISGETLEFQYEANPSSFVGSAEGGPLGYDYSSIMHYDVSDKLHTLPRVGNKGVHDGETGNRKQLSTGDVKQLREMYACDRTEPVKCVDMDDGVSSAFGQPLTCARVKTYCQDPVNGPTLSYFCPVTCEVCPAEAIIPANQDVSNLVEGCWDSDVHVCNLEKDYCPGKIGGKEQWMSTHCRRTCWITDVCGARPTPPPGGFITTTRATVAPAEKVMGFKFAVEGGGYDMSSSEDRTVLATGVANVAKDIFATDATVSVSGDDPENLDGEVALACGCPIDEALPLPCSIPCKDLKAKMMTFTANGAQKLNEQFSAEGLSGVKVQNTWMCDWKDRLMVALMNPTVNLVMIATAVFSVTMMMGFCCWYRFLHGAKQEGSRALLQSEGY